MFNLFTKICRWYREDRERIARLQAARQKAECRLATEERAKRDKERAERIAQLQAERQQAERQIAKFQARRQKAERRLAAEECAKRAKERAYQEFLETNQVTGCDAPSELDENGIKEQRRAAMRLAKQMQDSMPD